MNQTTNYKLNQWQRHDRVLMDDFNADNAIIDAALAKHDAAMTKLGNCRVEVKTYTGSGKYGAENPNRLYFSGKPQMILIAGQDTLAVIFYDQKYGPSFYPFNGGIVNTSLTCTWSGSSVSFYAHRAAAQMNEDSRTYCVLALYAQDA